MLRALPFALLLAAAAANGGGGQEPTTHDEVTGLVRERCATCHAGERPRGRLDLASFDVAGAKPALLDEMLDLVRAGDMPPPQEGGLGESELTETERAALVAGLERALGLLAPDPGRPTLRRLNRVEYGNAVRALLEIDLDVERDLPADASSEGFDNQGDVLFVTPELSELYLDATERAIAAFVEAGGPRHAALRDAEDPTSALADLLEAAFRRPATAAELDARLALLGGEEGLRACLASVLLSPKFLFRVEEDRSLDEPWPVSAWELATRVSFFLWATPPDEALRSLARDGSLLRDEVLLTEVERMLDDPRSVALADRFAGRWLGFADLPTQAVDVRRFSGTHDGLKRAMAGESALFFDALVREDRTLLELIDAESTFLNATLARHYGIDGVEGGEMRRVALDDRRRGGVLTQASVLTMTSQPLRTSPVVRGAWILDRLFGTPPPPPPPNAGTLPADDQLEDGLTLRQRLEQHRSDPACAACHARMDPLGFALENYDGVGRWRDADHVGPVDARAVLPDGREIDGILGLKDALLEEPERIARGVTEALLVYAVGRPLEPGDEPVVAAIVARLRESGWSTRTLVRSVAQSYPFRYRRRAR